MLTAADVATAVVIACRFTGEQPLAIAGHAKMRARPIAFGALRIARPDVGVATLAHCVGYRGRHASSAATNALKLCRRAPWWSETAVDEVVGALVADQYGEQGR